MIPPGLPVSQLTAVLIAMVVVDLVVTTAYLWTIASHGQSTGRNRTTSADGRESDPAPDGSRAVVECPDCRVANEVGYRYCRACVAELPNGMEFADTDSPPFGRIIR